MGLEGPTVHEQADFDRFRARQAVRRASKFDTVDGQAPCAGSMSSH
jgi:hypothetical protein